MALSVIENILTKFPRNSVSMIFAYGSGVFKQLGHKDPAKNMIDLVFVVGDPYTWHEKNLIRNRYHYSFLKYLGAKQITKLQLSSGARIYYNTLVKVDDRLVKYGVISDKDLLTDLLDWNTLYVSGRLHKPVKFLHCNEEWKQPLKTNLESAVHSSLLLLPERFNELEFFKTVARLSYDGDFRMIFGEDKKKVDNIVEPHLSKFKELYNPILTSQKQYLLWDREKGNFEQDLSTHSRYHHMNFLPKSTIHSIVKWGTKDGKMRDTEEIFKMLADSMDCPDVIATSLRSVVSRTSITQSLVGILTGGIWKSIQYSGTKIKKMFRSMRT